MSLLVHSKMFLSTSRSSRYKLCKIHLLALFNESKRRASVSSSKLPTFGGSGGAKKRLRKDISTTSSREQHKATEDANHTNNEDETSSSVIRESCSFSGTFRHLSTKLSERLVKSLESNGFTRTTVIQKLSIPLILDGCDVLIRSATGSGKTLTYLVPSIQRILSQSENGKISRKHGTKALIINPTRELSVQTALVASKLSQPFPWIVVSCIKGGDSRKREKARIRKGVTIMVGTPGRLLDHCETTSSFNLSNLDVFVMDEADRLLDMGFEVKIKNIFKCISNQIAANNRKLSDVQNILTSATLTNAVESLADFCLRTNPRRIGTDEGGFLVAVTVGRGDDGPHDSGERVRGGGVQEQAYVPAEPAAQVCGGWGKGAILAFNHLQGR